MTAAAWETVADAADIGAGSTVLDLGCGDGAFCDFAARRGANVHGIDMEPDAIAEAVEAVPGADVRLGMMESLPWPDDSFDVVTSFNALQYALDTEMALTEASRVTRPDGRIAICKWGPPAENEFFAFLLSIGAGGVREESLPATDPVEDAIRSTRSQIVANGEVPAVIRIDDEAALELALSRAGVSAVGTTHAAEPYRQPDGTYRFKNLQRYWILGGGG